MEHRNKRQHTILHTLCQLPNKIVQLHGTDNITEFVLHELCCENCFNLNKAAYFVDNPDFNCLKGVAGVSRAESFAHGHDIWHDPHKFSVHMQSSPFNRKVRECAQISCKNCENPDESVMEEIADRLGLESYSYQTWPMKHDNHGYLIYEKMDPDDNSIEEYLCHGLGLLAFCPIF